LGHNRALLVLYDRGPDTRQWSVDGASPIAMSQISLAPLVCQLPRLMETHVSGPLLSEYLARDFRSCVQGSSDTLTLARLDGDLLPGLGRFHQLLPLPTSSTASTSPPTPSPFYHHRLSHIQYIRYFWGFFILSLPFIIPAGCSFASF